MDLWQIVGNTASIVTLVLFIIYIVGRVIVICSSNKWIKDRVVLLYGDDNGSQYDNIVEDIYDKGLYDEQIYGLLVSEAGMRHIRIYDVRNNSEGMPLLKGNLIYSRDYLNIGQSIALHVMTGDLFPTLFIEYDTFDYLHVMIEWADNRKNGVLMERVKSKHTIKSIMYYFFR